MVRVFYSGIYVEQKTGQTQRIKGSVAHCMVQGLHHKRDQRTIIFQTETPAVSSVIRSAEGICVAGHHETM